MPAANAAPIARSNSPGGMGTTSLTPGGTNVTCSSCACERPYSSGQTPSLTTQLAVADSSPIHSSSSSSPSPPLSLPPPLICHTIPVQQNEFFATNKQAHDAGTLPLVPIPTRSLLLMTFWIMIGIWH